MKLLPAYLVPKTRRPTAAEFVPRIREAVDGWRAQNYEGASDTTRRLLEFWFLEQHMTSRGEFVYYFCQREAVETLVYLYEVAKAHRLIDLMQKFGQRALFYDPTTDRFPRYVFKMATGSGKTNVMALAVVWSYFHSLRESGSTLPKTFLLIAPNVIVFERLKKDFGDGRIFHEDPLVPPEWKQDWQMSVILRDDPTPSSTIGTIYLTNVQRLYERGNNGDFDNPVEALLGPRPKQQVQLTTQELLDRIVSHGELLVLNDEAHHLHLDDLVWNQRIVAMDERLRAGGAKGLAAQLDFTATPKTQQGRLFTEVVVDYPVAQAIDDGIVKRPILGEIGGDVEIPSDDASIKWRQRIDAGVAKWREFAEELQKSGKKPVLFIMTEDTKAADQIADDLQARYPDLAGKVLNIHTNRRGDVVETKSNLPYIDELRQAARQVDSDANPYKAIVSVLMLREGWDVRNVVVIVPLRPYTAKANILPEQTLGRGLRLMQAPGTGWDEHVIVIDHEAFRDFWDKELKEEGLEIERRRVEALPKPPETILVDQAKLQFDLEIPQLSPALTRSAARLSDLTLESLPKRLLPAPTGDRVAEETIHYTGRDMLTKEIVEEQDLVIPLPDRPDGVIAYFTNMILRYAHLPARFAELAPVVTEYLTKGLFKQAVSLDDPRVIKRLSESDARQTVISAFVDAIHKLTIEPLPVRVSQPPIKVSSTSAFPRSGETYRGAKTVFNLVACDSHYEALFASFLDRASDVAAYAKNADQMHFFIEYIASGGGIRYYYPDFIVRTTDGDNFLVETKGWEDVEVPIKDDRARKWCHDVTNLTGEPWYYVKVPKIVFDGTTAATFDGLYRHALAAATQ